MPWPLVLLLIVIGVINAVCGYLIWRRRVYGLIAGYDPRRPPRHPERLARWVGVGSLAIGFWCMASGIAIALLPSQGKFILQMMALGIVPSAIVLIIGAFRRAS